MATTRLPRQPPYPHIRVQLVGMDGNAFSVLGRVTSAMRAGGLGDAAISLFLREALGGSYADLLAACARWIETDGGEDEGE